MEVSEPLKLARRVLDGSAGIEIENDWQWHSGRRPCWILGVRLRIPELNQIPEATSWKILCEDGYPWGDIDVYPSQDGGIDFTLPHQLNNRIPSSTSWRSGKICLSDPISALGRLAPVTEPFESEKRLRWHVDRLRGWLLAAESGTLAANGDRFELPDFSADGSLIGFSESEESLKSWLSSGCLYGTAQIVKLSDQAFAVKNFSGGMKFSLASSWGSIVSETLRTDRVLWIRLPRVPILKDWDVPLTWGELKDTCNRDGVDLMKILKELSPSIRDGRRHFLLLGFPISNIIGEENRLLHWQGLALPLLSHGKNVAKGFRRNNAGYWSTDLQSFFHSSERLEWVRSENWAEERIRARGSLSENLIHKRTLLVGAGSLNSVLAELLVRLGVKRIDIADSDRIQAGNLARHTLTLDAVGSFKSDSLAQHLSRISPHATISSKVGRIQSFSKDALDQYELIIDGTGDDGVLAFLADNQATQEQLICSFSINHTAEKLFCFCVRGKSFPFEEFRRQIDPFIKEEAEKRTHDELIWEGVGCWHPHFEARIDDLYGLARLGIKWLESHMSAVNEDGLFAVYSNQPVELRPQGKAFS